MARAVEEWIGKTVNRLTVLEAVKGPRRGTFFRCRCACGKEAVVYGGHIRDGSRKSCGCVMAESKRTHGQSRSPEYKAWENARSRCQNPRNKKYPLYGGRGITFSAAWRDDFEAFLSEVGPRPSPLHSLDRIDSNGNYEPGNVRWATDEEQNNNRASNRHVTVNGERMTVAQASRATGIPQATILGRLDRGLSDGEAIHG